MENTGIDSTIDNSLVEQKDEKQSLTFFEVLGSTFAAAIGVQSKANKNRDFSQGKPLHFIFSGIIFATVFVVSVVAVVRTVLSSVT